MPTSHHSLFEQFERNTLTLSLVLRTPDGKQHKVGTNLSYQALMSSYDPRRLVEDVCMELGKTMAAHACPEALPKKTIHLNYEGLPINPVYEAWQR